MVIYVKNKQGEFIPLYNVGLQPYNDAEVRQAIQRLDTSKLSDASSDGKLYARQDGQWVEVKGDVQEAPKDDKQYCRKNGSWVENNALKGETINVTLTTNQPTHEDLIGATVTIKVGGEVYKTLTWQGEQLTISKIPEFTTYTIEVSSVENYKTPVSLEYKAVEGNSRNISFEYLTEALTVTVTREDLGSVDGCVIKINNIEHTLTTDGVATQKVPFDTQYNVEVVTEYEMTSKPVTQTFTANQASRSVNMLYKKVVNGVFILDNQGNLKTASQWPQNQKGAVGIAVLKSDRKLVMTLKHNTSRQWGGYDKEVTGITTTTNQDTALKDFNGKANTDAIIEQCKNYTDPDYNIKGAPAAEWCRSYQWPTNKSGLTAAKTYLPSLGEMKFLQNNKTYIEACLAKLDSSEANTMDTGYHWTSSQYSSLYAWGLSWSDGGVTYTSKTNIYCMRGVCAFNG